MFNTAPHLLCPLPLILSQEFLTKTYGLRNDYRSRSETFFHSRGIPDLRSCVAYLPKIFFRYLGGNPYAGRIERIFSCVNVSPRLMSFTTNKERRKARRWVS